MKSIEISASLPFSWCRFCGRIDLETQKWMADGRVEEIENVCANAAVCEACEWARAEELRKAAAQKKSEGGQDDAAEEGEALESLKLGAAFDAGFAQGFILARGDKEALPEAGVVWARFCRLNNLDPDTLEPIQVIGVDLGDGEDRAVPITNAEQIRRVLPALSDQAMLNLLRGGVECDDCPMRKQCRDAVQYAHDRKRAPDLTCGERWERWMEETVK